MVTTLELMLIAAILPAGAGGGATSTVSAGYHAALEAGPVERMQELRVRSIASQQAGSAQTPEPTIEPPLPLPPRVPDRVAREAIAEPSAPLPAPEPSDTPTRGSRRANRQEVVRVGSGYTLGATDSVASLVIVMGDATIEGHVAGDLVVALGEVRLGPTAVVDGDLVVIGGNIGVRDGAVAAQDLVVVGGSLDASSSFMPGGQQVVVGFQALGESLRSLLPWLSRGLLLGRPIVPDLAWVWIVVGVLFVIYLGVMLVFDQPVRASADVLAATPLRALATGMVVVVLMGPIMLLLAMTVVGVLAIPFALCGLIVAGLVGRIAAARWVGARLVAEGEEAGRGAFVRSFVVGCAVLVLIYMVPVLGGVVWAMVGASGLGASVLAFVAAYRRENPPTMPTGQPVSALTGAPPAPIVPEMEPVLSARTTDDGRSSLVVFPRASFFDRLAAFVLDGILVALVIALLPSVDEDAFVPLFLVFRFAMWVWKGVTVGGIICQLRIIRVDGQPMSGGEALVRSFVSLFSVIVFGIGYLWMLRDPDGQTWHDRVAGTLVVKVPRNWPL